MAAPEGWLEPGSGNSPWEQWDVMDEAEAALGREGGRADVPARAVALLVTAMPEDPAPRGPWKREEIQFVGSSWLDASICAPLLIKLHSEQGRTGVLNKSQPNGHLGALTHPCQHRSHFSFCALGNPGQKLKLYPSPSLCVTLPRSCSRLGAGSYLWAVPALFHSRLPGISSTM